MATYRAGLELGTVTAFATTSSYKAKNADRQLSVHTGDLMRRSHGNRNGFSPGDGALGMSRSILLR